MISEPICVAPTGDVCGEGVVWHAGHSAAYWTDINRFLIHRYTTADMRPNLAIRRAKAVSRASFRILRPLQLYVISLFCGHVLPASLGATVL